MRSQSIISSVFIGAMVSWNTWVFGQTEQLVVHESTAHGSVVDPQNARVANCKVWAIHFTETGSNRSEIQTDADGKFDLKLRYNDGTWILFYAWEERQQLANSLIQLGGAKDADVTLKVLPTEECVLQIVDRQLRPIANAKVERLEYRIDEETFTSFPSRDLEPISDAILISNEEGAIRFPIPTGVEFGKLLVRHSDYSHFYQEQFSFEHASKPIVLDAGIPIQTRIVGELPTANALKRSWVYVSGSPGFSVQFNEHGKAFFTARVPKQDDQPWPERQLTLSLTVPGFPNCQKQIKLIGGQPIEVEFELSKTVETTGFVVDKDSGEPVSGLRLQFVDSKERGLIGTVTSDDDGRFRFSHAERSIPEATLNSHDYELVDAKFFKFSESDRKQSVKIPVRRIPTRTIVVFGTDSNPVPSAILDIDSELQRVGDAEGKIECQQKRGLYGLQVFHPTERESIAITRNNRQSESESIDAHLKPDISVVGTVTDELGIPVPKALVSIGVTYSDGGANNFQTLCMLVTNDNGQYQLEGLPSGCGYQASAPSSNVLNLRGASIQATTGVHRFAPLVLNKKELAANQEQRLQFMNSKRSMEIDCSKWWNSDPIQLADQKGKLIVLGEITKLNKESIQNIERLQWIQETYRDWEVTVVGLFDHRLTEEQIAKTLSIHSWTIAFGHSRQDLSGAAFMILPGPNGISDSQYYRFDRLLTFVRNQVLFPKNQLLKSW